MKVKTFDAIIGKDGDGWLIADVPALHGCHTQARAKKELIKNVKEVIELCLEVQKEKKSHEKTQFVGIEKVSVYA